MAETSELMFIQVKNPSDPAALFLEWIHEAEQCGIDGLLMNLATASKDGDVSNRTVVIREVFPDASLAFMVQEKSNKIKDITENPRLAATVLLMYATNRGQSITRQIRFKGVAEKLPQDQCKIYFEKDGLPGKIRSWICQECRPVDWKELKAKHDALLKEVVENKKVLEMPKCLIAYKIIPHEMEFYHTIGNNIADRLVFIQENEKWICQRTMT